MPNYCNNTLTLSHPESTMITKAAEALKAGNFLETFIPIPPELKDTTAPANDTSVSVTYNGSVYSDWYQFCVNEWGTKWDLESYGAPTISENGLTLECGFDSAWSPPTNAYLKLEELGFEVNALYYEPGMGFCGEYSEGFDQTYDIPGNADDAEAEIPAYIDEAFAIVENMRMWEEEQIEDDIDPVVEASAQ